jgi:Zinc knuckle
MNWREAIKEKRNIYLQNKSIVRTTKRVETEAVVKRHEEAPKCYVCNKTGHYARNGWERKENEQRISETK